MSNFIIRKKYIILFFSIFIGVNIATIYIAKSKTIYYIPIQEKQLEKPTEDNKPPEQAKNSNNLISIPVGKHHISDKEMMLINSFLKFSESSLEKDLGQPFSPNNLAKDYSINEVAADQKYKYKYIIINGSIKDIDSPLEKGGEPIIYLKCSNKFETNCPHLSFIKELTNEVANLRKNDNVSLICMVDGGFAGIPFLKHCQFKDEVITQESNKNKQIIIDSLENGRPSNKIEIKFAVRIVTFARILPDNNVCYSDSDLCIGYIKDHPINMQEYLKTYNDLGIELYYDPVIKRYHIKGLD